MTVPAGVCPAVGFAGHALGAPPPPLPVSGAYFPCKWSSIVTASATQWWEVQALFSAKPSCATNFEFVSHWERLAGGVYGVLTRAHKPYYTAHAKLSSVTIHSHFVIILVTCSDRACLSRQNVTLLFRFLFSLDVLITVSAKIDLIWQGFCGPGGGYGMLGRAHGLLSDRIEEVTVVLASGEVVVASKDRHPHLLWACKVWASLYSLVSDYKIKLVILKLGPHHSDMQRLSEGCITKWIERHQQVI